MGTNLNMGFYILLCFFTGSKLSDDRYEQNQCIIKEYGKGSIQKKKKKKMWNFPHLGLTHPPTPQMWKKKIKF